MAAFDFPNSPNNGDTYSANGIDWIYNGSVWKKDATPGVKGQKGDTGAQGQKGDTGAQGIKGDTGSQGQKGDIGPAGGTGGQGQKGDTGAQGIKGDTGSQGQKGEDGTGADGIKGQKGDTGAQGQKGNTGAQGSSGTDAQLPVGTVVAYGGNSAPSGWQLCNGGTASTSALQTVLGQSTVPDLRDRFIIGAGNSYSRHNTGGSKDAVLVSHNHPFSTTASGGSHVHQYIDQYVVINNGYRPWPASNNDCAQRNINTSGTGSHTHSVSGTTDVQGTSATNANLPPYYALVYIIKT